MAAEQQGPSSWLELLLPDEDLLDYSMSFDYVCPSPIFRPRTSLMIPKTRFITFPKLPPSLTPNNPAWQIHDKKRSSANSVAFDYATDDSSSDGGVEAGDDHYDRDESDKGETGRERVVCSDGIGRKVRGCGRCGKQSSGLLLRGREGCLVCGAEYCKKCVLKAMGAMPEGRKCVGCIGKPIDEANRGRLGKGSRLLARLCSRTKIKQVMQAERECKANRLRPQQVIVNGSELGKEELEELLACPVPPRHLSPGRYWYDKDSGLWGKEGQKPDRIISSKLYVGGKLQIDASGGDAKVYMNGREITKVELRVLKLAKVQCPRDTHFWLYDDGSYEEEGQNNIQGNIWEKVLWQASMRFLCSLFSLPVPPKSTHCTREEPASISARPSPECLEQRRAQKLLLMGLEGSGTSTIFKQAKFIYKNKFTSEELQNIKVTIQSNTCRYLCTLLEGREQFEEETLLKKESARLAAADKSVPGEEECDGSRQCIYSVNQKIVKFSDWLLDLMATRDIDTSFPAAAREYAPIIDEIWKDPAIQETYKRRGELQFLPDVAKYFLDRVIEISSDEYEPSQRDILFAEGVAPINGVACIEFSFDDHSALSETFDQQLETQSGYQLIQFSSKGLHDGCKWLVMLEGMSGIIFCVSLSDYDQLCTHGTGLQQNKMLASRAFFQNVAENSCFEGTPILLLLTKYNAFEDKISQVPLTVCEWFSDFNPLKTHSKSISLAHQAYYYIAVKFKELYSSLTGRKLYVCPVQAHDPTSVDEAFRYMREILTWEELRNGHIYEEQVQICHQR